MKMISSFNQIRFTALLLVIVLFACKKANEYRNMVPLQQVNMNTYDFIKKSNATGLYDTLLYLLDKTGLSEKLKTGKVTFFAPQDFSIGAAMYNLNFTREKRGDVGNWTVDSVRLGVWDTLLTRYMLDGMYDLDSLRFADGVSLVTPYGHEMNGKAITTSASGVAGGGSMVIQYSDKNNSRLIKNWVMATTESANLKTTNGIVHMLEPKHIFGYSSFNNLAYPPRMVPYQGKPISLPGTIEIAYFNKGGEGVAYHDQDPGNRGTARFRFDEGVDIDNCTEGLFNAGYTVIGEWTKYTVKVEHTGLYNMRSRVASPNANSVFRIEMDEQNISGPLVVPKGTSYQDWKTVEGAKVFLQEGEHIMMFYQETGGFNVSRFGFTPAFRIPYNGIPHKIPGVIPACEFDYGDEGVSYKDNEPLNRGNARTALRFFEGPDTENTNEGGFNLAYSSPGEWTKYTVDVAKTGQYRIDFRVASTVTTGRIHLEFNGVNITGAIAIPNTKANQTFATVSKTVTLQAGQHDMKFMIDANALNIAKFTFVAL